MVDTLVNSRIYDWASTAQSQIPIKKKSSRSNIRLFLETIIVTIAAIGLVKLTLSYGTTDISRLIIPGILIMAALLPTIIKRQGLKQIGLNTNNAMLSLRLLCLVSLLILPSTLLVLLLLRWSGLSLPLQQSAPPQGSWLYWLGYQFLYVALPEEIFFRGYLQSNILMLAKRLKNKSYMSAVVFISAFCFAAAHVVINPEITVMLTFLPGLVFGWLFLRTGSLVAPVLFHVIANTFYCLICIFIS